MSTRPPIRVLVAFTFVGGLISGAGAAPAQKFNPASKIYVSDVSGEAIINTGEAIEDLAKRSVYPAQGVLIETKKPENESDRRRHFSTMVYSNGTGAFFDADTRVEVRRFVQEPFTPNRADVEIEPSISQTQAYVARGTVALCTSKLVAGTSMTYATPHASVNIRGRRLVIESSDDVTKISMIEGESTIRAGAHDLGVQTVRVGEQAIIRRGPDGQPNLVEIIRIPPAEAPQLDERVSLACQARRTVYFDVRESDDSGTGPGGPKAGGITAFNSAGGTTREIVPVPIVPVNMPVQFTVSPAAIVTPSRTVSPGP